MPAGVAFGFVAYALYSCCDAIIKGMGDNLPVYEIAFFSTLFSLLPAVFTKPKGEHWRHFWRLRNPRLVHLRGLSGVLGNLCVIYAFISIPLAEAYSLAFLAPLFIVVVSVSLLGERVSGPRWLFLALSFAGVLLVGLGCEVNQIPFLLDAYGLQPGPLFQTMTIQETGGTRRTIEVGVERRIGAIARDPGRCRRHRRHHRRRPGPGRPRIAFFSSAAPRWTGWVSRRCLERKPAIMAQSGPR